MRYQISGKHIDVGDALQTHVRGQVDAVLSKYAGRPTDSHVIFSRDAHEFVCEAVIHLSTGLTAQARAHAPEIYAAFDGCAEKLDKQLRRYKRRLKNHHAERVEPVSLTEARSYVLSGDDDEAEGETGHPLIVAESVAKVPGLSVGEAVMQMELSHAAHLIFRNVKHGGINVVYRRDDGNVGWLDPGQG